MRDGKPRPAGQLPLGLPHDAALGRADFLVGRGNREAVETVDRWPKWPERGVLLVGPAGSGKSHLTAIWCAASGAPRLQARDLHEDHIAALSAMGAVAVEDLHAGSVDERALFHLFNTVAEQRASLLVTSRTGPGGLHFRLADLVSRLRAAQLVPLGEPDEELLRRVMTKLFADRQLSVEPAVVDFIMVRMERSFEAANALAERLDRASLAGKRAITKRLAGEVLDAASLESGANWQDAD